MDETRTVEKHYCYDHPLAYAGARDNDGLMAAMLANNGGMGGAWNNPFIYLVWMMMLGRNGIWGNDGVGVGNSQQLQTIQDAISNNHNNDLAMQAIQGNNNAIRELAQSMNCDYNALSTAICGVRSAIDNVAGQVGFSSERVINAVNTGNCSVIQALKDCCCTTQQNIIRMGYENQLGQKDLQSSMVQGFAATNTGLERGFSSVAYETQKQTCDILNAGNANTQRIIDVLNSHWSSELQQKYNDARLELSQTRQNAYLISQLKTTATT